MRNLIQPICLLMCALCLPAVCEAHFAWVVSHPRQESDQVRVFFSQVAEPDDPALLKHVRDAEVWAVGWHGDPQKLELSHEDDSLTATLPEDSSGKTLILRHRYGVFTREEPAFLLNYYAKTYPFPLPGTWDSVDDAERLPLEIVPTMDGERERTFLKVSWKGKPAPDCQVVIEGPGLDEPVEGTTDEAGTYPCRLPQSGVYSIRARLVQEQSGTLDGQDYSQVRHYSTLALRYQPVELKPADHDLPELPEGTTSFGGAIASDTLFVYGGNYGTAHEYSQASQSGDLWALSLSEPSKWKKLASGPKLQGLALMEHNGLLYRLGGFTAMNAKDEPEDLQSQSGVARFDPETGKWNDFVSLPEPRSSFDAAVLGDTVYVVGGWNMPGKDKDGVWHKTAWSMNLASDQPEWKAIAAPPFTRRALAVAAWNGKLYGIGGMRQNGGPTTEVDVYDPATDSWSKGPRLLGSTLDGFGSSAFACDGSLYASTISGSLQRLSKDGKEWEFAGQLEHPRFFHQLLCQDNSKLIAVGGGHMSVGKVTELDVVAVKANSE